MTAAEDELARVFDGLVDDALEVLGERSGRSRPSLRLEHAEKAYGFLVADFEHAGRVTLTARMLANLLEPVPVVEDVKARYVAAEERRRAVKPAGWLSPETFERCVTSARAALENSNPADGGTA